MSLLDEQYPCKFNRMCSEREPSREVVRAA